VHRRLQELEELVVEQDELRLREQPLGGELPEMDDLVREVGMKWAATGCFISRWVESSTRLQAINVP
jgi:hypothetical protein